MVNSRAYGSLFNFLFSFFARQIVYFFATRMVNSRAYGSLTNQQTLPIIFFTQIAIICFIFYEARMHKSSLFSMIVPQCELSDYLNYNVNKDFIMN